MEQSGTILANPQIICPQCGTNGNLIKTKLKDRLFNAPGEWNLRRCNRADCGLVWIDPMPKPEEIAKAYKIYYTHSESDEYSLQAQGSAFVLKKVYAATTRAIRWMVGIDRDRSRASSMFLEDVPPGRILDVGCGAGSLLSSLRNRGWDVLGSDFDQQAVEYARLVHGLDVRLGGVENFDTSTEAVDVITLSHVIEHVHEPWSFLETWATVLRPGGSIIIRTPNIESIGYRWFGANWRGLEPPRHLQIYTAQSMRRMIEKTTLKIDDVWTTSAAAETIWVASIGLKRTAAGQQFTIDRKQIFAAKVFGPIIAIYAKTMWWIDRNSGEELCVRLYKPH